MEFQKRERLLFTKLAGEGLRRLCLNKRKKEVFSRREDRNRFLQNERETLKGLVLEWRIQIGGSWDILQITSEVSHSKD